jgi:hypothetical protein
MQAIRVRAMHHHLCQVAGVHGHPATAALAAAAAAPTPNLLFAAPKMLSFSSAALHMARQHPLPAGAVVLSAKTALLAMTIETAILAIGASLRRSLRRHRC